MWLQEKVSSSELIIKQIKTTYNIADINTKALSKDRHHCLLFMLGFVCNGSSVGEEEFARIEAKEMLKQQVRMVSHAIGEQTQQKPTSKMNHFAKQVLRIISVWSVVNMAEGSKVAGFLEAIEPYKALGLWHSISSPMLYSMVLGLLCILMIVGFMFPYGRHASNHDGDGEDEIEPDPEAESSRPRARTRSRTRIEPTAEPPTSQFAMHANSLGSKYPTVMSDVMVRPEGILVWLRRRCELRVQRQNKVIHNRYRMDVRLRSTKSIAVYK